MELPTRKIHRAVEMAFQAHSGQTRKITSDSVLCHLFSVALMVGMDGGDEDEIVAGLLHDAVEDAPDKITHAGIEAAFGKRVSDMVRIATDTPEGYVGGPKPPWLERKKAYIEAIKRADPKLLRPVAADKVDNITAIISEIQDRGISVLEQFSDGKKKVWYFESCHAALLSAGFKSELTATLRSAISKLKQITEGTQENA